MTVQELLDILNNPEEIPDPKYAELCFYLEGENGKEQSLELKRIGAFDISTDITFTFGINEKPVLIKAMPILKPYLQRPKGEAT